MSHIPRGIHPGIHPGFPHSHPGIHPGGIHPGIAACTPTFHLSSFILHGGKDELFPIPAQQDPANSLLGGLELAESGQQLRVPV